MTIPDDQARRLRAAAAVPGLGLLVVHGSRARGDGHAGSDWDFGFLEQHPGSLDVADLGARLTVATVSDHVDLADLVTASALLRFRAARDGVPLVERPDGAFRRFQLEAVLFWCDAGPVIRAAQSDVLAALG